MTSRIQPARISQLGDRGASNITNGAITSRPKSGSGDLLPRAGNTGGLIAKPLSFEDINKATNAGTNTAPVLLAGSIKDVLNNSANTQAAGGEDLRDGSVIRSRVLQTSTPPNSVLMDSATIARLTASMSGGDVSSNDMHSDPYLDGAFGPESRVYSQQLWNTAVRFFNHKQEVYTLNPAVIMQLVLYDCTLEWQLHGYVIVDNRGEGWERSTESDGFYQIRGDGRDEILVDVWPGWDPRDQLGQPPDETWRKRVFGVVYDVEDLPSANVHDKKKKIYFWDKQYHLMKERHIEWSTATGTRDVENETGKLEFITKPIETPIAHATDDERSMFVGEAIASLLTDAGFGDYIDTQEWELGETKICFTARADWSLYDNLMYLVDRLVSRGDERDIVYFHKDRWTQLFQLTPMYKIFERAGSETNSPGELQVEHLFFEAPFEQKDSSPFKAPFSTDYSNLNVDIKSADVNIISDYIFDQQGGIDNSLAIVSKPVHSYDAVKNQFQVDAREHEITAVREYVKKHHTSKLLGDSPVMPLNLSKKTGVSIAHQFSIKHGHTKEARIERGRVGYRSTVFSNIYLNQCLSVRLPGSSHRQAGKFTGVDRLNQNSDTTYDHQLCGQYWVTDVVHVFQQNKYINDMTMVKINSYKDLEINEDIE